MAKIILFDGVCNLCEFSVQFIIKRDPKGCFRFASLQSEPGEKLKRQYSIPDDMQSVVLIEDGNYYTQSTAALKICRQLRGFWKLLYALIIIPKPIRNLCYRFIADHRYQWFGKKQSCMLPTPELKKRFL
ncbi:thiol-disulfide oxidoreductase DCC family protein [Virgibacillus sp. 179-BFC.A HS]|uniref:Thiol-disulfide oxidoreductase DCC family protein n=1 Tax=Tigheibacillus jepli TaxID=3035914 RepID=A0ABU5CKX7_9BACI|nr:thiol-disulfide oxidoreductase DCC family protein [Virgibacillus sp. 179-BFC.A HS]MDY0407014.1 thiol-disulfide oxidoreductase DCC family protein [Virgibacillus sp. 179-BFC.A HS]